MGIFMTLASPHLGIMDNDNYLVRTGVWFLANWKNVKNLQQLSCEQQNNRILLKELSSC